MWVPWKTSRCSKVRRKISHRIFRRPARLVSQQFVATTQSRTQFGVLRRRVKALKSVKYLVSVYYKDVGAPPIPGVDNHKTQHRPASHPDGEVRE
jgi:hypothetical protein